MIKAIDTNEVLYKLGDCHYRLYSLKAEKELATTYYKAKDIIDLMNKVIITSRSKEPIFENNFHRNTLLNAIEDFKREAINTQALLKSVRKSNKYKAITQSVKIDNNKELYDLAIIRNKIYHIFLEIDRTEQKIKYQSLHKELLEDLSKIKYDLKKLNNHYLLHLNQEAKYIADHHEENYHDKI